MGLIRWLKAFRVGVSMISSCIALSWKHSIDSSCAQCSKWLCTLHVWPIESCRRASSKAASMERQAAGRLWLRKLCAGGVSRLIDDLVELFLKGEVHACSIATLM